MKSRFGFMPFWQNARVLQVRISIEDYETKEGPSDAD